MLVPLNVLIPCRVCTLPFCMGLHGVSLPLCCVLLQVPLGPKVQDNTSGKRSQNRTYTDLLKDEHDMEVIKYYSF